MTLLCPGFIKKQRLTAGVSWPCQPQESYPVKWVNPEGIWRMVGLTQSLSFFLFWLRPMGRSGKSPLLPLSKQPILTLCTIYIAYDSVLHETPYLLLYSVSSPLLSCEMSVQFLSCILQCLSFTFLGARGELLLPFLASLLTLTWAQNLLQLCWFLLTDHILGFVEAISDSSCVSSKEKASGTTLASCGWFRTGECGSLRRAWEKTGRILYFFFF